MNNGEVSQNKLFRNKQSEQFLNLNRRIGIPPIHHQQVDHSDELDFNLRNFIVQDVLSQGKKEPSLNMNKNTNEESSFINTLLEKITKLEKDISKNKEEYDKDIYLWKKKSKEMKIRIEELERRETKMKSIILDMTETFSRNQLYNKWHFDIQVLFSSIFHRLICSFFEQNLFGETSSENLKPESDQPPPLKEKVLNMNFIQEKFKQLNRLIEEDVQIQMAAKDSNIHKFVELDTIQVLFFKNGIVVDGGALRPYEWPITKQFLRDIFDGYFPYEFKERFPDGVKLIPIDRSTEIYSKEVQQFKDAIASKGSQIKNLDTVLHHIKEPKVLNKQEFLKMLPQQVIRHGKVIPIREELKDLIQPSSDSKKQLVTIDLPAEIVVDSPCYREIAQNYPKSSEHDVVVLRIKSPPINDKTTILLIQMFEDSTLTEVKQLVVVELQKYTRAVPTFEFRAFPSICFKNENVTLKEANLTPKAFLFCHKIE